MASAFGNLNSLMKYVALAKKPARVTAVGYILNAYTRRLVRCGQNKAGNLFVVEFDKCGKIVDTSIAVR